MNVYRSEMMKNKFDGTAVIVLVNVLATVAN